MKLILSSNCIALTGMLKPSLGYHIEHRKNGYFAKRNSKGPVPPDGHWRFIVLCAELAQNGLYIADIQVSKEEVYRALRERGRGDYLWMVHYPETMNSSDVIALKKQLSL